MTKLGSNGTGQIPPPSRAPPLAIAKTKTCFLRLGDGVTGRDCSIVGYEWGRTRLAQSPGLGDP